MNQQFNQFSFHFICLAPTACNFVESKTRARCLRINFPWYTKRCLRRLRLISYQISMAKGWTLGGFEGIHYLKIYFFRKLFAKIRNNYSTSHHPQVPTPFATYTLIRCEATFLNGPYFIHDFTS